ncbi:hypothetical protein VPH35_051733 [Triticum aestivum]
MRLASLLIAPASPAELCAMAGGGSTGGPGLAAVQKLQPAECKKGLLCIASSPCLDIKFLVIIPRELPTAHPSDQPDVVCFFQDEHLIGVDVRARKVVGCEVYELIEPPPEDIASRFIHAWPLPPLVSDCKW